MGTQYHFFQEPDKGKTRFIQTRGPFASYNNGISPDVQCTNLIIMFKISQFNIGKS